MGRASRTTGRLTTGPDMARSAELTDVLVVFGLVVARSVFLSELISMLLRAELLAVLFDRVITEILTALHTAVIE